MKQVLNVKRATLSIGFVGIHRPRQWNLEIETGARKGEKFMRLDSGGGGCGWDIRRIQLAVLAIRQLVN